MTVRPSKVDTYIDHEGPVAERYQWWGVFLIREKRRLQGIAEAVAGGTPLVGMGHDTRPTAPIQREQIVPPGVETPDEMLTRVDAELEMTDALSALEDSGSDGGEESKAQGSSLRDEETIPDDLKKRKLSGRASLLGRKKAATGEGDA